MNRDEIHAEILSNISSTLEKRVGSLIYIITRPIAIVLEKLYQKNSEVEGKLDIENLSGDELASRIYQRTGRVRRAATFSIGTLTVNGNGTIYSGDLFETENGIQFEASETVVINGTGTVKIKALVAGETGDVPANQIIYMPVTLDNINSVTNEQPTYDGFAEESDEDLLERYYDRVRTPSTSGNKYHYLNWAREISGVGDAKVFPLWNGDNTVKVVLINSDRQPASQEIVSAVQEYIDPNSSGLGEGEAPLGAFCTVVSATGVAIDISFSVTLSDGYTSDDIINSVSQNIVAHLKEIAFNQSYVSYAQIGSIIINTNGVSDYTNLTVNSGTENIVIQEDQVAILGVITIV
ncbi:baseplate J/gp47 family protein [Metabacillus litoralis]|uniref:baseplate J/gp47 family protein n=1 Tax=Metabacillus litoralis TaxID=152268 RepID=UPI0020410940|nr:baseplate J/gp47 family protein [Metabacillus litoralis]MCM3411455.1 baseplate J/gp47 family protein [Metabacillus litoralis]